MVRTYEATLESPREIDIYLERKKPLIKFMYSKQVHHITLLSFFEFHEKFHVLWQCELKAPYMSQC